MRQTGNPKIVQRAMNHSDITSTMRYLHALPDETLRARAEMVVHRISPGLTVDELPTTAKKKKISNG